MIEYIFTGQEERNGHGRYILPENAQNATHVSVHPSVTFIPASLFDKHENIVELICHDGVMKIESWTFGCCPRLKRVIMRGVKVVEKFAFYRCEELEYVECPKLEKIESGAFGNCKSLRNINLPSAKEVDRFAFDGCEALTEAKFGKNLVLFGRGAFLRCPSLESITIPLRISFFPNDDVFQVCDNLRCIDFVEGALLHETVGTLLLEEWRDDMNAEIDSINQILPGAYVGEFNDEEDVEGEKTLVIREWIARVLSKIIDYKAQHRNILNEASSALQSALPDDIVANSVIPFLELPLHRFVGEEVEEEDEDRSTHNSDASSEYTSEDADGREEDEDGDDSHDQLEDSSVGEEGDDVSEQQQQQGEGMRKRRKAANGD